MLLLRSRRVNPSWLHSRSSVLRKDIVLCKYARSEKRVQRRRERRGCGGSAIGLHDADLSTCAARERSVDVVGNSSFCLVFSWYPLPRACVAVSTVRFVCNVVLRGKSRDGIFRISFISKCTFTRNILAFCCRCRQLGETIG